VVINSDRSDKTEMKKFFSKISDHQQSVAAARSRGHPHTPQLCCWSLIWQAKYCYENRLNFAKIIRILLQIYKGSTRINRKKMPEISS
jgi:hypothetical protein